MNCFGKERMTMRVMKFATIGLINYCSAAEIGNNASVSVCVYVLIH